FHSVTMGTDGDDGSQGMVLAQVEQARVQVGREKAPPQGVEGILKEQPREFGWNLLAEFRALGFGGEGIGCVESVAIRAGRRAVAADAQGQIPLALLAGFAKPEASRVK